MQARHDIRFNAQIDRVRCRPWGLYGGLAAEGNGVAIHRFGLDEHRFPSGKALNQTLVAGDAYILRSGGGGGFGSPLERDLAAVANDVRQGYVSTEAAERLYGAVFVAGTVNLDAAASAARREAMRAQGLPRDEPEVPDTPSAQPQHHPHTHGHEHDSLTPEERLVLAMSGRCCS